MSKTRQALMRTLLAATETMVQGGLSETWRRCGKPSCACQRDPDARHGPHVYLTYRADDTSRSLYVPAAEIPAAQRAHQAWAVFWETGCALAAVNRARLRRQWQGRARRRPATGSASRG